VCASTRRATAPFVVTRLSMAGTSRASLVLLRGRDAAVARALRCARDSGLTDRQHDVLLRVVDGDSNRDIATKLRCAEGTAELHVSAVLRKFRVKSRAQLVARFWSA
jgi:DNA-binding CsgD family transcriptional regulator